MRNQGGYKGRPTQQYEANAGGEFDGSTDLELASDLSTAPDLSRGVISFWMNTTFNTVNPDGILDADGGVGNNLQIGLAVSADETNGTISLLAKDTSNTFLTRTGTIPLVTGVYQHILLSWDTNFSAGNKLSDIYINDASNSSVIADAAGALSMFTPVEWAIGREVDASPTNYFGGLSEFFARFGTYTDISVKANRRKFISSTGRPVFLGSDGSSPFGAAPDMYFKGVGTGFNVNSGAGDNFTTNGTLTTPTTSPSKP